LFKSERSVGELGVMIYEGDTHYHGFIESSGPMMKDSRQNQSVAESATPKTAVEGEKVVGGLEVEALLRLGSEHLFLLFTQSRVILAHHAKIGRASVPLYGLLGKMSEGMRRTPEKRGLLEKMALMDPAGILRLHSDNFSIEYPRVVSLTVERGRVAKSRITIVTTDQKIELYASPVALEGVRDSIQSLLGGKADYKR